MDFTLTPDQLMLRDAARAMLGKECPPTLVRAVASDPTAADGLWRHLADWVPLADGPLVDLCLFLEECGRVLLPGPFFPTVLARPLSSSTGTASVALAGPDGQWVPNDSRAKTFVIEADRVDALVVVDPSGFVVTTPGACEIRAISSIDASRRVFEVTHLSPGEAVEFDVGGWLEWATVALSAEMIGAARALLERTTQYAKDRVQFDKPIGSFQAVQHKLADVALAVERAWSAVYYAAMCIDADDPDRHRATHVAKASAGAAATKAAKDGIQVHGGIGYTWEHDLHLFIRRAYASEHLLGTTSWHHDRLADLLLD